MKKETFDAAFALSSRIANLAAASKKLIDSAVCGNGPTDAPYKLELHGLPDNDRKEIRCLVLDYLDREENRAQASFDAL